MIANVRLSPTVPPYKPGPTAFPVTGGPGITTGPAGTLGTSTDWMRMWAVYGCARGVVYENVKRPGLPAPAAETESGPPGVPNARVTEAVVLTYAR